MTVIDLATARKRMDSASKPQSFPPVQTKPKRKSATKAKAEKSKTVTKLSDSDLITELSSLLDALDFDRRLVAHSFVEQFVQNGQLSPAQWRYAEGLVRLGRKNLTHDKCPCCAGRGFIPKQIPSASAATR